MGNDELVPRFASSVEPSAASRAAVPIQMGFVRLGGMRVRVEFPDSGYRETIPMGRLYPSTREMS